jgi:hypothetical protein
MFFGTGAKNEFREKMGLQKPEPVSPVKFNDTAFLKTFSSWCRRQQKCGRLVRKKTGVFKTGGWTKKFWETACFFVFPRNRAGPVPGAPRPGTRVGIRECCF